MCLHVTFIPIIAKIGGVLTWSPAHPSQLLLFLPAADGLRLGQPGAGKMAALIWKNEFCWAKWGKMSWNFREFCRILFFSSWEFSSSLSSTHLCPVSPIAMRSGAAHWRTNQPGWCITHQPRLDFICNKLDFFREVHHWDLYRFILDMKLSLKHGVSSGSKTGSGFASHS